MTLLSLDITIQIVKCYWSSGAELVNFCTRLHSPPVWRQHSILLPTSPPPQTQSKAKSSVAFGPPALTETPAHVVTQSGRVWSHGGGGGSRSSVSWTSGPRGNRGARGGSRAERPGAAAARSHVQGPVLPPQRAAHRRLGEGGGGPPVLPAGLFFILILKLSKKRRVAGGFVL